MSAPYTPPRSRTERILRDLPIAIGLATGVMALAGWSPPGTPGSLTSLLWSGWLVAVILACSFRAMAHADVLAERFGEPYGTLILTISAITIEVAAVCAVMLGSQGDASVARDTMFSVLMIILNGLVGLSMLIAGWRRAEQEFNPQSAAAYLPLIVALGMLTLVLPRFTRSEEGGWMSDPMEVFVGGAALIIYGIFLWLQTTRHRTFFAHDPRGSVADARPDAHAHTHAHAHAPAPAGRSALLLVLALVGVILLAEGLSGRVASTLDALYLPSGIGGVFIALLVLAPEGLAALRSAGHGDLQRSVNVLLGSACSTIGLTVPAVMAIRFATGASPEMGLDPPYVVLLGTTFLVTALGVARGRVTAMQGAVHLLIFLA